MLPVSLLEQLVYIFHIYMYIYAAFFFFFTTRQSVNLFYLSKTLFLFFAPINNLLLEVIPV